MKKLFFVSLFSFFFFPSFAKSATVLIQPIAVSANVYGFQGGDWLRFVFNFEVTTDRDVFLSSVISPSVETTAGGYTLDLAPIVSRSEEGPAGWFQMYEGFSYSFSLIGWLKPSETSVSMVYLDKLVFSNNGVDKYTLPLSDPMKTNSYQLFRDQIPEPSIAFLVTGGLGLIFRRKR